MGVLIKIFSDYVLNIILAFFFHYKTTSQASRQFSVDHPLAIQ